MGTDDTALLTKYAQARGISPTKLVDAVVACWLMDRRKEERTGECQCCKCVALQTAVLDAERPTVSRKISVEDRWNLADWGAGDLRKAKGPTDAVFNGRRVYPGGYAGGRK